MPYSPTLMFFTGMCIGCCIPSLIRSRACDPELHQEYRGFSRAAYWINRIERTNSAVTPNEQSIIEIDYMESPSHSPLPSQSSPNTDIRTKLPVAKALTYTTNQVCIVEDMEGINAHTDP